MAINPILTWIIVYLFFLQQATCWINPFTFVKCSIQECCNEENIPQRLDDLAQTLDQRLFGQHIAKSVIINALTAHIRSTVPSKPLAMAFHGQGGVGKTYVANMIIEHFFKEGKSSRYCHSFNGRADFPRNDEKSIKEYQESLKQTIVESLLECAHSMFVIDDVDMIAPKVLDVLLTYMDYGSTNIQYKNSRIHLKTNKAIFIFIANTGSTNIMRILAERLAKGTAREQLTMSDFETGVIEEVLVEPGGFKQSEIIDREVIDHFIPFLPLEAEHVRQCVLEVFNRVGRVPRGDAIQNASSHVTYLDKPYDRFIKGGCRRIEAKVKELVFKRGTSQNMDDPRVEL